MSEMGSRIFSDIGLPASAHCVPFRFSAKERRKKRALHIAEKLLVRLLTQYSRLRLSPFPNRSPTKWVRFGEEKQRSEQVFALARKRVIRSLLRRGRRARCARFPTCGVVRVAGYSVVWDCGPTPIFLLKSTKRSAAAISRSQRSFISFSWCASEYFVVGRISCHDSHDSIRTNVCQWYF